MAEFSGLWTTGSTGDGATAYSRVHWSSFFKVLAACLDDEGVAAAYLQAMAGSTTGANNARINTGGAVVDGKVYYNDAAVDVTIPSAVGGGNTRIDRVVLRADWTAQTVRITRIAGTDAASPTAPAITQTSGSVYDILLCQALVNTSGTVAITMERTFAKLGSSLGLTDGIVTAAKIAVDSVDDTLVGNRVPALTRRQGGSATNWSTSGTTTYTPTTIRVQTGVIIVLTGGFGSTITFPVAFSDVPVFIATPSSAQCTFQAVANNATAATIIHNSLGNVEFNWVAIGPE